MGTSWNDIREMAKANPYACQCVRILDGIMYDYVHDEERYMEPDMRDDLAHDIMVYRGELRNMLEGGDGED